MQVIQVCVHSAEHDVRLVEGPSTLLLPVNENGTFSCKALCDHVCSAYWVINGSDLPPDMLRMHQQYDGNTSVGYTLTLTINASHTFNNTRIACRYEANGVRDDIDLSTSAFLFVIQGMCM